MESTITQWVADDDDDDDDDTIVHIKLPNSSRSVKLCI